MSDSVFPVSICSAGFSGSENGSRLAANSKKIVIVCFVSRMIVGGAEVVTERAKSEGNSGSDSSSFSSSHSESKRYSSSECSRLY